MPACSWQNGHGLVALTGSGAADAADAAVLVSRTPPDCGILV